MDYLVRTHGPDALVGLIRSYADGRTDDEAFKAAIGLDVEGFNEAWLSDVDAKAPTEYGPKSPAPGPVPSAWAVAAGGGAPGGTAGPAAPAAPAPSGAAVPGGSPTAADSGSSLPIVLAIFAALAALIVIAVLVARNRRRAADDPA